MPVLSATGSFACPGSTGSQAVTGVGFKPKAVFFFYNEKTADGSAAGGALGFGISDASANQFANSISDDDALGTSNTGNSTSLVSAIRYDSASQAAVYQAAVTSMDTDGFTVNWTTVSSGVVISYLAIGGADVRAKVGNVIKAAVTGNQAVTGVGFQPTMVLNNIARSASSGAAASTYMDIGVAKSSSSRWLSWGGGGDNVTPTRAYRAQRTDGFSVIRSSNSTLLSEADFVSMDSDGFTINWTTNDGGAQRVKYLALAGASFAIGSFTQKTSTGNQSTTGTGFRPSALFLVSINNVTTASVLSTARRISMGIGVSSTSRRCYWEGSVGAAGTSSVSQDLDSTKIIKLMTEAGASPTTQAAADLVSMDSNGFTLNWTTADATAREILYIAFGPQVSPSSFISFF